MSISVALMRPLQARKQHFVRREIWEAAIELFSQKGYDAITVEEIAAAAGVSRRTFFRYFPSKDDLMVEGVASYQRVVIETIREHPRTQRPLAGVRGAVTKVAEYVIAQPHAKKVMQIAERSAPARRALLAGFAEIEDHLAAEFAARSKPLGEGDYTPRILASLTLLTLNLTFRIWFEQEPEDVRETVDGVFLTLSKILCPSSRRPANRLLRAADSPGVRR